MPRIRKKPHQLLAYSLSAAKGVARNHIVKSTDLGRKDRERLVQAQYLTEIIRGWYLLSTSTGGGQSTAWFGGFWDFLRHYLNDRFGEKEYCLSAETSLNLHVGDTIIPGQLIVLTKKESNTLIDLPHQTSLFLRTDQKYFPSEFTDYLGIPMMTLTTSLCRLSSSYFQSKPQNVELALRYSTLSIAEISRKLIQGNSIASAERLIGALLHLNEKTKAEQIRQDLEGTGHKITPQDPFIKFEPQLYNKKVSSPYKGRIEMIWKNMRKVVEQIIPASPGLKTDKISKFKTINMIQEKYKQDAYHSLSIEGYFVTEELISKIQSGDWDPEHNESDLGLKNLLAAKGYWNSFKAVLQSTGRVLKKENPGHVLESDLHIWHRELFLPLMQAQLIPLENFSGFRQQQVFIQNSRHVPPPCHALLDCMEIFFELLKNEPNPAVRAVLGHFIFVYIHPYMDGNGRIGRFIMNLMLISGGFNWTVIRVEKRTEYMMALEKASTEGDIAPFAEFIMH